MANDAIKGRCAFTVQEFCETHRISRSMLYQLWGEGLGPKVLQVGVKKLITAEAAAEWRANNTAPMAA